MIPVYLQEGCGKTLGRINDTMPHTWIVWVDARRVHSHIATQEMSAIRLSSSFENFHIFLQGLRKHFQYVCYQCNSTTKLKIISETNNTHRGHCNIFMMIYEKVIFVITNMWDAVSHIDIDT